MPANCVVFDIRAEVITNFTSPLFILKGKASMLLSFILQDVRHPVKLVDFTRNLQAYLCNAADSYAYMHLKVGLYHCSQITPKVYFFCLRHAIILLPTKPKT